MRNCYVKYMEFTDYVVIFGLIVVVSAFTSWFWRWLFAWRHDNRVGKLEERVLSLENSERGQRSVEVKAEKAARMQEAITKAGVLLKAGKDPKEVVTTIGLEYADVAMDLLKNKQLKQLVGL